MNIGLIGVGRMGQAIEPLALRNGHQISWKIGAHNRDQLTPERLKTVDVVIEFSRPEAAYANVMAALEAGVPVVSGTTGWLEDLTKARQWCLDNNGALLWASNFSVGVNLLFAVNRYLAGLMEHRPEYAPRVEEIHHIHKLDAPSGTAMTITQDILNLVERIRGWKLYPAPAESDELTIRAFREGDAPGTHTIQWSSPADEILLEHRAKSRAGFAEGAVLAAEWLQGKRGVFSMSDVLGL